jgi:ABC-type cobalamin/Fe3+-siderophores transport system ATPase subunit
MNIIIIGKTGVGKSNLADILKNVIFKMDSDSEVMVDDPDRESKQLGSGKNIHTIKVVRENEVPENLTVYDMVINIKGNGFQEWYSHI